MPAAGQTGSGKTYTMQGAREDPGVNFRALDDLFRLIAARSPEADYEIHVSLTEVTSAQSRHTHAILKCRDCIRSYSGAMTGVAGRTSPFRAAEALACMLP